jgi:hypothetical protein
MRGIVRANQLRQSQRTRHTRRTAADDDHISRHLRPFNAFDRFAENQHKNIRHGLKRITTDKTRD